MSDEPRLVSITNAADLLGIGRTKAHELVRDGRLPTVLLGSRRMVSIKALDEFVAGLPSLPTERYRSPRCAYCGVRIFGGPGAWHTQDGAEVCPSGKSPTTFHEGG